MQKKQRQKRYEICRQNSGFPHLGRPFTCRACGKQACWTCALHFWREKQLPGSGAGLDKHQKAIEVAERDGKLLGCCSEKCRRLLPFQYAADFRLPSSLTG